MISRHENERCPLIAHEPQRLVGSRSRIALGRTPRPVA